MLAMVVDEWRPGNGNTGSPNEWWRDVYIGDPPGSMGCPITPFAPIRPTITPLDPVKREIGWGSTQPKKPHLCPRCEGEDTVIRGMSTCKVCKATGVVWG